MNDHQNLLSSENTLSNIIGQASRSGNLGSTPTNTLPAATLKTPRSMRRQNDCKFHFIRHLKKLQNRNCELLKLS